MTKTPVILKTKRLILRPWCEEDLEPFARMNADPRVREYFSSILSKEVSDQHARYHRDYIQTHGWGFWAVEVPNVAKFIGFIGLEEVYFSAHFTPAVEIGWRLAFDYWGHGYASEGAKACLQYGFETLKLKEIVAYTATNNKRSIRVMKKMGMIHSPSDDFDHPDLSPDSEVRRMVLYRIKQKQWQQQQKLPPVPAYDPKQS
jgi:3-dehydroquinate dehydratase / shikimate dehydrogenase